MTMFRSYAAPTAGSSLSDAAIEARRAQFAERAQAQADAADAAYLAAADPYMRAMILGERAAEVAHQTVAARRSR